ncbi:acyltransferase [Clostridium bowmanii]|uniref:acyltransferase n=1 Tax=Clostridium bowmanii TaxID=132925 RepID=UPI001C0AA453|nr:acyltransferase [Clostridium bowmanii]MBU3188432.1 acyltransferase [Clostridium bowmanii]MCA1072821.1 acyltransferase [Clostridium bowmanii]
MLKFKSNYFKVFMKFNKVQYGEHLNLIGLPVIFKQKKAELTIGNDCLIKSDFLSNLVGLYQRTIIVAREEGKIHIGSNVGISGATIYSKVSIEIGNYTNIGGNVKILDHDFHPIDAEARKMNNMAMVGKKPIIIGENVFVGCNSIILKGTEIGDNSVVGAGSVVSGKFPANVVIAGNPARIIKRLESNQESNMF